MQSKTQSRKIKEPYQELHGGAFRHVEGASSPDPLIGYRWDSVSKDDALQIYNLRPKKVYSKEDSSFYGLESVKSSKMCIKVKGSGTLVVDFGVESAGWFEITCESLSGVITMGISEYNQEAYVNIGPASPSKTGKPKQYGNDLRLELNDELYEGVRFGFINVEKFEQPFCITDIRLVCQAKPVNYLGSFESDSHMLNRIWYTAAYTVRANLKKDYFSAILIDRGDRYSWTGDAYPAQAAALAAFGNYDFVYKNLQHTSQHANGIESYEIYWVFSLMDFYRYSGDKNGLHELLNEAEKRLDHAYEIYERNPPLQFFGWDERLGAGFENPNIEENQYSYQLLCIRAWKEFSAVLAELGYEDIAGKYAAYDVEKETDIKNNPEFYKKYGLHASADAINANILENPARLYHKDFEDRINRVSYSPFNEYFILRAMAKMGRYDDAISAIYDLWGGQIRYGGTTFFETFRPDWNDILDTNSPVPNNQAGYTSLAHPWSAGVLPWISEEVLGVKPLEGGFKTFIVMPHPGRSLKHIKGAVPTPYGKIKVDLDIHTGIFKVYIPYRTAALIGIPKVERTIEGITLNGKCIRDCEEDEDFIYIKNLPAGSYVMNITYRGVTPIYVEKDSRCLAPSPALDRKTGGDWIGKFGKKGFALFFEDAKLPDYVKDIKIGKGEKIIMSEETKDRRALQSAENRAVRRLYGYKTGDNVACKQTMTIDILLKEQHEFQVSLYFADWEWEGRVLAVEMFDKETLNLIAPMKLLDKYENGAYLVYRYDKSVRFRINQVRGPNVYVSGIFFD